MLQDGQRDFPAQLGDRRFRAAAAHVGKLKFLEPQQILKKFFHGFDFRQMRDSSHQNGNSQAGKEAEKEPTPSSSKLSAPIRGLIGCEMVQIGSMLFPVLAFGAFLRCRRRRRGAGGLGLGRFRGIATATRSGFAVAGGRGGGHGGRSVCGFAHSNYFVIV
jgi:hypothetical protein